MHSLASWLVMLLNDLRSYREPYTAGRAAINGLGHALQTATRAERDDAPTSEVVMALVHDAARPLNDVRHGEVIAEIMAGRLPPDCCEALRHHGELGADAVHGTSFSQRYFGLPWYETAVRLQKWDGMSYDPRYPSAPLNHFLPLLEELCST